MKKDVIIFLGQSNMQGQTDKLSENEPVNNAWEYRYLTDTLVALRNPVGENITYDYKEGQDYAECSDNWHADMVLGASVAGKTNMVPEFARSYCALAETSIVAVHAAKGATVISDWIPGTPGFEAIVKKTQGAIAKIGKGNIGKVSAVWLQGESDALEATPKEIYAQKLVLLKKALDEIIGLSAFGIIKVGKFASEASWCSIPKDQALKYDIAIQSAQADVCKTEDGFVMLTEITDKLLSDPELVNPYESAHFGARGQEILGAIAGYNLAAYLYHKPSCKDFQLDIF